MTTVQKVFTALAPKSWARSMEAESRQWMVRCPACGNEVSVWESGGVRWRAAGNPRRVVRCGACGRTNWHVIYKRNDATPSLPPAMFTAGSDDGYRDAVPGIRFKTLAHGAKTLLAEFHLAKGSRLPRHSHPHEQTGYLVRGALRFTIGEKTFEARAGDAWCIPGSVEHEAVALEDSVAVEVFSPVREEYL